MYDFTYKWNLKKKKKNKYNKTEVDIYTENKLVVVKGEVGYGMNEIGVGD